MEKEISEAILDAIESAVHSELKSLLNATEANWEGISWKPIKTNMHAIEATRSKMKTDELRNYDGKGSKGS